MRDENSSAKDVDPDVQSVDVGHQTGWLKKLGGKFKTWRKRFFVLQGKHISYYTSADELRLLGQFSIENVQIEIPDSTDNEFGGDGKGYIFILKPANTSETLAPNHQQFVLSAATPSERKLWIRAIRKALYLKHGGALFGSSLQEVFAFTRPEQDFLPRVVYESAAFIREHGMTTEGIFRKCGTQNLIQSLAEAYDLASPGPILQPEEHSVHIAAGLLKLYLRELPEPVIPFSFYDRLKATGFKMQIGQDLEMVVDAIEMLPAPNYHLLQFLCQFLYEVSEHHEINLMTIENLASIFAPNILRQVDGDLDVEISAAPLINLTCTEFIRCHKELFRLCIAPSSQARNILFGSTRQRHHGNTRRRQTTASIMRSENSYPANGNIPSLEVESARNLRQNQLDSSPECAVESNPLLSALPSNPSQQESPSQSSGIGRSTSGRSTRNGGSVIQTGLTSSMSGESLGRRDRSQRRHQTTDQYEFNSIGKCQDLFCDSMYADPYPLRSSDRQGAALTPTVASRNASLTMHPNQRSSSRVPKRSLFSCQTARCPDAQEGSLRKPDNEVMDKGMTWSLPQYAGVGSGLVHSTPLSDVQFHPIQDELEEPPKPPPFNLTPDVVDSNHYPTWSNDSWYRATQPIPYRQPNFITASDEAGGSMTSSVKECTYMNRLDPEEQIRYWRTLATHARMEAAGHRARARSLVNELSRVRCDLNMAELEIGLLRQRLADSEAMQLTQACPPVETSIMNQWAIYP